MVPIEFTNQSLSRLVVCRRDSEQERKKTTNKEGRIKNTNFSNSAWNLTKIIKLLNCLFQKVAGYRSILLCQWTFQICQSCLHQDQIILENILWLCISARENISMNLCRAKWVCVSPKLDQLLSHTLRHSIGSSGTRGVKTSTRKLKSWLQVIFPNISYKYDHKRSLLVGVAYFNLKPILVRLRLFLISSLSCQDDARSHQTMVQFCHGFLHQT